MRAHKLHVPQDLLQTRRFWRNNVEFSSLKVSLDLKLLLHLKFACGFLCMNLIGSVGTMSHAEFSLLKVKSLP